MAITLVGTLPAAAEPPASGTPSGSQASPTQVQPSTSDQAKQAWLDASDKAEAANEDLLAAQGHEEQARAAAGTAKVSLAKANLQVTIAESTAVQAAAGYAAYRGQLAEFAGASFRGARLGQLSALLTAKSSADYLDEVSSLDQVAGHTRELMAQALVAKKAAESAAVQAETAQQQAAAAKGAADAAVTAAEHATKAVADRKATLDSEVATYRKLFDSLTAQERQAAMDAQQAAWELAAKQEQERQAQLLAQRQQQAAQLSAAQQSAADQQQGNGSSSASSSSSQSSPSSSATSAQSVGSAAPATRSKAQIAVAAALTRLGYPYVFGAAGPGAFDCSGLTSWAWAQAGVRIPRTSAAQARLPYVPLDQLQPGDLVTYYSPVHHVALYIGNGQIIDAATESKPIFITSVYRGGPNPTGHRVNY